jgi:DNA-binding protein YbaB
MAFQAPDQITPENLDGVVEAYDRRARDAEVASERIRAIRAVGRSTKGLVEVEVDGSALVVDVRYAVGAASSYATLGSLLKQAHDRALVEWNRQVKAVTEELLDDDEQLRAHIQRTSDADFAAHVDLDNLEPDER